MDTVVGTVMATLKSEQALIAIEASRHVRDIEQL
jgi:hypothetical protein